jgi:hypothetical protein
MKNKGVKTCFLLGTSGDGRQDGGVSVRVAVHGRDGVPGDAQLHREGALHERREECRHHIRGRQQWYLTTGQLLPQQFLITINTYTFCLWRGTLWFYAGNIHYKGHWKGWALKSRLFWALKWQRVKRVPIGSIKVLNMGTSLVLKMKSLRNYKTILCSW